MKAFAIKCDCGECCDCDECNNECSWIGRAIKPEKGFVVFPILGVFFLSPSQGKTVLGYA